MDTAGTFRVKNASAVTQVEMGRLSDSTYGFAAVNPSGTLVKLNNFLFGPATGYVSADYVGLSTSYVYGSGSAVGPFVSGIEIGPLGKAIVYLSATLMVQNDGASMSVEVDGPSYRPPSFEYDLALDNRPSTDLLLMSGSRIIVFEGLLPGTYTFRAMYKSAAGVFIDIAQRYMLVQPY